MKFHPQKIKGLSLLELTKIEDERGYFARTFCEAGFQKDGHPFHIHQSNVSYNAKKHTLRGMHYQDDPIPDPKVVRCLQGRIFDVVVDLRIDSPSYLEWVGAELSAENNLSFVIPAGCAHGFLTLSDDTNILYLMGAPYVPDLGRGVRWDDSAFAIDWPETPQHMNERDTNYPDYVALT